MQFVGLRELRRNASDLVRRVEAGEEITITVAGRSAARLVPAIPRTWRQGTDVAELFEGPADPDWDADREMVPMTCVTHGPVSEGCSGYQRGHRYGRTYRRGRRRGRTSGASTVDKTSHRRDSPRALRAALHAQHDDILGLDELVDIVPV